MCDVAQAVKNNLVLLIIGWDCLLLQQPRMQVCHSMSSCQEVTQNIIVPTKTTCACTFADNVDWSMLLQNSADCLSLPYNKPPFNCSSLKRIQLFTHQKGCDTHSFVPVTQIVLNGGNQHIFQSALRATARLNLLSPAVFPLPFGAKLLPLPPPLSKGIQEGQESDLSQEGAGKSPAGDSAATGTAGTTRVASLPNVADDAKRAQHAEQRSLTARAEALNTDVHMRLATQGSRHTKHAKHGQPAPHLPDPYSKAQSGTGASQSLLMCQGGKGASRQESFRAGSHPQQGAMGRVKAHDSTHVVGPVAKLVSSSAGLVSVPTDESEVQSQSLGR